MKPIITKISQDETHIRYGWLIGYMVWGETKLTWGVMGIMSKEILHRMVVEEPEVKRSEAYATACVTNELKRIASTLPAERQAALRKAHEDLTQEG
jgi:hypothetical protein